MPFKFIRLTTKHLTNGRHSSSFSLAPAGLAKISNKCSSRDLDSNSNFDWDMTGSSYSLIFTTGLIAPCLCERLIFALRFQNINHYFPNCWWRSVFFLSICGNYYYEIIIGKKQMPQNKTAFLFFSPKTETMLIRIRYFKPVETRALVLS